MKILSKLLIIIFFFLLNFVSAQNLEIRMSDGLPPFFDSQKEIKHFSNIPFEQLDSDVAPFVDTGQFEAIIPRFQTYVKNLKEAGYNAIALDDLNHLILLDKYGIYKSSDIYARNKYYIDYYNRLIKIAKDNGISVYIKTDMQFFTDKIEDYAGKLDGDNPKLQELDKSAFEEIFQNLPGISGIVMRIGEGGKAYNSKYYYSKILYTTPNQVNQLLQNLLPVFQKYDKKLIFRTWTIGIGQIGDLINNPKTYDQTFKDIDSPNIIISTKYTPGDFFRRKDDNPLIGYGNLPQIVEFEVRREYEGGGDFPNYIGDEYQSFLQKIKSKNNIVGLRNRNQEGGWGFGKHVLFNFGFNFWNEVNFWAVGEFLQNPDIDSNQVISNVLNRYDFIDSQKQILTNVLQSSREIIKKGRYIDDFRQNNFKINGISIPPLLRIWWDKITTSPIILSMIYYNVENADQSLEQSQKALDKINDLKNQRYSAKSNNQLDQNIYLSLQNQYKIFEILQLFKKSFFDYFRYGYKSNSQEIFEKISEYKGFLEGKEDFNFSFEEIDKYFDIDYWKRNFVALNLIGFGLYLAITFNFKKIRHRHRKLSLALMFLSIGIIVFSPMYFISRYNFYWILSKINLFLILALILYFLILKYILKFWKIKLRFRQNLKNIIFWLLPVIISLEIIILFSIFFGEQIFWAMIVKVLLGNHLKSTFLFFGMIYILIFIIFGITFSSIREIFKTKKSQRIGFISLSIGFLLFLLLILFLDSNKLIILEFSKNLYPDYFNGAGSGIGEFL